MKWLRLSASLHVVERFVNKVPNWVTADEVEALRKASRKASNPARKGLTILMLYRHGLRVSELCHLKLKRLNLTRPRYS